MRFAATAAFVVVVMTTAACGGDGGDSQSDGAEPALNSASSGSDGHPTTTNSAPSPSLGQGIPSYSTTADIQAALSSAGLGCDTLIPADSELFGALPVDSAECELFDGSAQMAVFDSAEDLEAARLAISELDCPQTGGEYIALVQGESWLVRPTNPDTGEDMALALEGEFAPISCR